MVPVSRDTVSRDAAVTVLGGRDGAWPHLAERTRVDTQVSPRPLRGRCLLQTPGHAPKGTRSGSAVLGASTVEGPPGRSPSASAAPSPPLGPIGLG